MAQLLLSPIGILVQQLSNAGQPLSGGLINSYVAGTTTPVVTYTDSTGSVQNSNPIVLNSAGRLTTSVWVPSNTPHKMILTDANSNILSTIDQLYGINDPFLINQVSSSLPTGGGTGNAQTITNTTSITTQGNGTEQWYTPGVANTGDVTINVDGLGAMHVHYLTKVLVGGELQPGVPVIIKSDGTFWNLSWSAKGPVIDYYSDSGITNTITVAIVNAVQSTTGVANGFRIKVKVANTNTATSVVLGITSAGSLSGGIYYSDGTTLIAAGALIATNIYDFIWNSSLSGGAWICTNPSRVTGSFTVTVTGHVTADPTGTMNYAIEPSGKFVTTWTASTIAGVNASNSTACTLTGIPAAIQPVTTKFCWLKVQDAGAAIVANISVAASSTFVMGAGAAGSGGFTASGAKGMLAGSYFSYPLD